ncbi:UDP-glycosyltransferase 79A2-like [Cryptomeria japonica]|uniref:UDP-glycosyltransferase 79A2-like n=1 Tax=Cryptomeria japonica TaxID=3369 RepID=UPI0027DA9B4C|nr:UDP-glycosyltransferase 79A2-like [Cryptomeria japonica]
MTDQRQLHVLKFPWLAHGHITPFLELAKSLTSYGLKISFLSTQLDIERIKQKLQPSLGIRQVQLPIPSVDGLPTGVKSTSDLSRIGALNLMPLPCKALDLCVKPFEELLKLLSPDFVIPDMVQYWAPRVAAKLGIPTVHFEPSFHWSLSDTLCVDFYYRRFKVWSSVRCSSSAV